MMVILIIIRTKYFFKLEKVVSRPLQFKSINWFSSTDSVRNWAEGGGTCVLYFLDKKIPEAKIRQKLHSLIEMINGSRNVMHQKRKKYQLFFPGLITSWNNVITHFNNVPSFDNLKEHIRSLIRPEKKSIFGIHDPSGVRYLFQLRVGLSPLRYHKNRHNFIDTPSNECSCNHGIEDTNYFFLCSYYDIQRATLLTTVIEIIRKYNLNDLGNQSNLYLCGHRSIDLHENRKILPATINYIKETRRFLT